ncbi:MAG: endonuclease/exonuclease/phosphatase family protein [Flavobacteriales bacterium]|nr:endonuclease/exonuclease/phosphatase family protein [Flavobacteriales bacterium]
MKVKKRNLVLLFAHFVIAFFLLSINFNQWINPKFMQHFEYIALSFPILILLYLILTIYWFFRIRTFFYLFLFCLIFFIPNLMLWINTSAKEDSTYELKAMSYNLFYGKKKGIKSLETYVKNQKPDVLMFQEIWSRQWKKQDNFLTEYYTAVFPYVGISSKYPIIDKQEIDLYNTNGHACWADIVVKKDTIRAFSVYLEPIYLTRDLFKFSTQTELEVNTKEVRRLLGKGFRTHEDQLFFIKKEIQQSPYPVIVGGDLNAVPSSYEYFQLASFLQDGFREKGDGLGTTYHEYFYPLKIDYTFFDDNFEILYSYVDHKAKLSDHFPIMTYFRIKEDYEKVK